MSKPLFISFLSAKGIKRFTKSRCKVGYWNLSASFLTQQTQTYCGVASSVTVLNALPITKPVTAPYAPHAYFTQENYFSDEVQKLVPLKQVLKEGMTLKQLSDALNCWECKAVETHAGNSSLNQFRKTAKKACNSDNMKVIVNFDRTALGQEGAGHFSPIAAYSKSSDSFLVLDVARYKYPPFWVKAKDLFNAMNTVDSSSNETRGWCFVNVEL